MFWTDRNVEHPAIHHLGVFQVGFLTFAPGEICLPGARLATEGHDSSAAAKTSQDVWAEDSKSGKWFAPICTNSALKEGGSTHIYPPRYGNWGSHDRQDFGVPGASSIKGTQKWVHLPGHCPFLEDSSQAASFPIILPVFPS